MTAKLQGYFPLIISPDVGASRRFYERHFGFTCVFDSDWYVHLIDPNEGKFQLGIVVQGHESVPDGFREATRNFVLSFEVPDAKAAHANLEKDGLEMARPMQDEPWGQRHFMIADPTGNLVDVIERIPPSKEFAEKYLTAPAN